MTDKVAGPDGSELSEGLGPISPMEQLLAFCDWERKHNPHPQGKLHVAAWAAAEIERLAAERDTAVAAERERIAAWLETQRNETPAQGLEFAAALTIGDGNMQVDYDECQHYANCGGICVTPDERAALLCESCLGAERDDDAVAAAHAEALRAKDLEIERLREAFHRLRMWGGHGPGRYYVGSIVADVADWFDAGATGPLPDVPAYAQIKTPNVGDNLTL